MELVNLARVILRRVGSASRSGFGSFAEFDILRELADVSANSLMDFVKQIAIEKGEVPDALRPMQRSTGWNREDGCQTHVFNIQGPNTSYSVPYAECWAFPALKIGERFFRLDEVKRGTGTP